MKYFLSILISLVSIDVYCQNFTIGGLPDSTIYIGIDNKVEFNKSKFKAITRIEVPKNVYFFPKILGQIYYLQCSKPIKQFWIKIYSNEELLDSIKLNSKPIVFRQFVKTEGNSLLVSNSYPVEIVRLIDSIIFVPNVPWVESPITGFEIIISNDDRIVYNNNQIGAKIRNKDLVQAMKNLKSGDILELKNIKAKLPYDDGDRPQNMKFICK